MKNRIIILIIFFICQDAFCIVDTIQSQSKITDVTVFFSGAQITRKTSLNISNGKHILLIDKLPQEINPQSIQVMGIEKCKILSVKHRVDYQNTSKKGKEEKEIELALENLKLKIKELMNRKQVFDMVEKLLLDNSILSKKDDGATINGIKEAAEFYRFKLNEIKKGNLDISENIKSINKKMQEFYARLNKITSNKRKIHSQILIAVDCKTNINETMDVSYYISSAGWSPLYDFRVSDINTPIIIVYNANVFQSSGQDWKNVNIKLSTNNPSMSGDRPDLIPWVLGKKSPYDAHYKEKNVGSGVLKGRVLDVNENEGLAFANVSLIKNNKLITGATTDLDGQYTIKPIPAGSYNLEVTYVGFKTTKINGVRITNNQITYHDFEMEGSEDLLECQMVAYKSPLIRKDKASTPVRSSYRIAGSIGGRVNSVSSEIEISNYISNSLKRNVTNLEYEIDIPYSIPSDGEDYSIKIKEVKLTVNYVYHAVPKLDKDVFLTAEITNWTELNLLSGKSSIYYQGTFTGESYIDADQQSDTLELSLGRDRNILIKREGNKELYDKRTIGNYVKETIGWSITVKNNKSSRILLHIEDQYPISEKKSIEVETLGSTTAQINEKNGNLKWKLEFEPNEMKVLSYNYQVKYPKRLNLKFE